MFRCTRDRFATTLNSVQNGPNWCNYCKSSCHEVTSEPVTTPDPHNWKLNSCFSVFRNIWVHLGQFRYCTKLGAKWAELVQFMQKCSCHEVTSELFAKNSPDTHQGTLNSCFVAFRNVWVLLGPFCYCTKLGASGPVWCN